MWVIVSNIWTMRKKEKKVLFTYCIFSFEACVLGQQQNSNRHQKVSKTQASHQTKYIERLWKRVYFFLLCHLLYSWLLCLLQRAIKISNIPTSQVEQNGTYTAINRRKMAGNGGRNPDWRITVKIKAINRRFRPYKAPFRRPEWTSWVTLTWR
jgi:hypothetical protein